MDTQLLYGDNFKVLKRYGKWCKIKIIKDGYIGFIKNRKLTDIIFAQKKAPEDVFTKKKIPFRSFEISKRDEKTLGELFCFFILETILLGKVMKINPFNQPAVELIKDETKKILS